jgi:hypothetical protein
MQAAKSVYRKISGLTNKNFFGTAQEPAIFLRRKSKQQEI